ncbi:hypothetical protein CYLTODRAFT_452121 [Cylindrobasidium torrendii FP15055 ss-10]|uniref:Uncharacterized protein n=1 Tax=Cylindrobasidium torrendii FP15055 ss-10 TaxID=1314674 RepID=A0A0D7BHN4_9AGAR|nr:hypothetical protein CYLTODRAFT_452121 [Cylindrobasidium torrendii FP15055 ss-10]
MFLPSTSHTLRHTARLLSTTACRGSATPWFVYEQERPAPTPAVNVRAPAVPAEAPGVLHKLQGELLQVPHLDHSHLLVTRPLNFTPGPALPLREPRGRRRRGGTYHGEDAFEMPTGIWDWHVLAQVKEGTEGRGAIEAVLRVVRKTLLEERPALPLPPNAKKRMLNEWAMVDAGKFAVHILSQTVRERYFTLDNKRDYYEQ